MSIRTEVTTKYFDDKGHEFSADPIEETIDIKKVKEGFESKYLVQDKLPISPYEMGDDALFLVHYHSDFFIEKKDEIREEELADWYRSNKIEQEKDFHIFPVSALIHGNVSLRLGRRGFEFDPGGWDTSHVGACLASKKEWKKKDGAEKACEGLVETWNQYLSGDVYCLVKDKLNSKKKLLDSAMVCGYYGYDYAKKELKEFI